VRNNLDDRAILYLLEIFFLATEKRHIAHEKEVDKLVDPLTQAKLATMGYVPSLENPMISQMYGPSGVEWWESYIKEANITPAQAEKVAEMKERLWKVDSELRVERSLIDKQIKEFYLKKLKLVPNLNVGDNANFKTSSTLDMSEVIEFARQLNTLKKNFIAQRTLVLEIQCQLGKILQPRQHAVLLLKINKSRAFDWPRHVQTLKSAWQLFSDKSQNLNGGAGTSPSLMSLLGNQPLNFPPSQQLPTTNNTSNSANIIINGNIQNTFIHNHPLHTQHTSQQFSTQHYAPASSQQHPASQNQPPQQAQTQPSHHPNYSNFHSQQLP